MYFFVYACTEKPCTDDGCPEFNELTVPIPTEDIRGEIKLYEKLVVPVIQTETKDEFVYSLNECIDYLYANEINPEHRVPKELIIAQAAIETGWGKSRFANEGNNLFGIRTWDKDTPHMIAQGMGKKWPGWGVRIFASKCDSVKEYIRLLNEHPAYEDFRKAREQFHVRNLDPDPLVLIQNIDKFSTTADYDKRVRRIIVKVRKLEEKYASDKEVK